MSREIESAARATRDRIAASGLSIYEPLQEHPELVYSLEQLAARLNEELVGQCFDGPIRTRSKLAKSAVCEALGYDAPATFTKVQPRFPGQDIDVYVQKSDNLQIWNEEITPTRRYVLIGLDENDLATAVRVVEGQELAQLDTTGTPTTKFQAARQSGRSGSLLVSAADTPALIEELRPVDRLSAEELTELMPGHAPIPGKVLTIVALFKQLRHLAGEGFVDPGSERRRGEQLHRLVCQQLGLGAYADTGRFPDLVCQALEVKLQTSPTIDLGLVDPSSNEPALSLSSTLRHQDARYLVAYGVTDGSYVELQEIVMSTGADFFSEFRKFGGKTQNEKVQIHLPADFFD